MADGVEVIRDVGAGILFVAVLLVFAAAALVILGLGVHGFSKLVGTPLPMARDDPGGVEWGGLALDLLYGLVGAVALFACYRIARQLLPAAAHPPVGRALGALALLAVAVGAGVVAVGEHDLRLVVPAVAAAVGAVRAARGRSVLGDEESELPASFDTPVKIVNEESTTRVETFSPPVPRPFVFPGRGAPSRLEPDNEQDDAQEREAATHTR